VPAPDRTPPGLVRVTADQDAGGPAPAAVAPVTPYAPPAVGTRRSVTGLLVGSDPPGAISAHFA
jgi:hypothetical protein